MIRPALLSALALTSAPIAQAQPPPSATAGAFTALQVTTTDPQAFVTDWAKPGRGAKLQTERHTTRAKPISAFIVFRGCKIDTAGMCDVVAHLKLTAPGGLSTGLEGDIAVWPKRQPVEGYGRSLQAFSIRFSPSDPSGVYTLASDVTDRVAGVTVHREGPLTLDPG